MTTFGAPRPLRCRRSEDIYAGHGFLACVMVGLRKQQSPWTGMVGNAAVPDRASGITRRRLLRVEGRFPGHLLTRDVSSEPFVVWRIVHGVVGRSCRGYFGGVIESEVVLHELACRPRVAATELTLLAPNRLAPHLKLVLNPTRNNFLWCFGKILESSALHFSKSLWSS